MKIKRQLKRLCSKHALPGAPLLVTLFLLQGAVCAQYYQNTSPPSEDPQAMAAPPAASAAVKQWFQKYDLVRRQAQMKSGERQRADALMSKGLSMIVPGPEKADSQELLSKLIARYQLARQQLEHMPLLPATEQLHRGYYQYFSEAQGLFSDYLRVQDNLFAVDSMGKPIAGQLLARKENLESLDARNKYIDAQLRQRFAIPPYQY
jgi:hypothetical protein